MKIVFMGTPTFAVPILEELIEKFEVVLVVSQPDKPVGRKKILTNTPVKECALKHNIEVFQPENIKENYDLILSKNPDIIVTAAYGQIIPKILLECPKYKCINVHASLLPKYRGGAPIHRAIINGDMYAGVTIMYMAEKMDAGDIIFQEKLLIGDDNTTKLTERLSLLGKSMITDAINNIVKGNINPAHQDINEVSFAWNITKEEEKLDLNDTCKNVVNKIRGLAEVPGAYVIYQDKKVKIFEGAYKLDDNIDEVGKIVTLDKALGIRVKDGILYPTIIQVEGKNKMNIKDFLNGNSYFKLYDIIK